MAELCPFFSPKQYTVRTIVVSIRVYNAEKGKPYIVVTGDTYGVKEECKERKEVSTGLGRRGIRGCVTDWCNNSVWDF